MEFDFEVSVSVERVTGKFVSRDVLQEAIETAIQDALDGIDVSCVGDDDSEYEVTDTATSYVPSVAERKAADRSARRAAAAQEEAARVAQRAGLTDRDRVGHGLDAAVAEVEETGAVFTVTRDGEPVAVLASPHHIDRLRAEAGA